uniref:Uncharacterized protein n=1 Tax=Photinus pyralis TaxID=7054 RepID=A0A1Y1LRH6_PHOPY
MRQNLAYQNRETNLLKDLFRGGIQRHPTVENHIGFKRARAISRRIVLESKRKSWNEYTSSITTRTDMNSTSQNITTEDSLEIANTLANHFANMSSSANYPDIFSQTKNERETDLCFATARHLEYNAPFILKEMEFALRHCKKKNSTRARLHLQ